MEQPKDLFRVFLNFCFNFLFFKTFFKVGKKVVQKQSMSNRKIPKFNFLVLFWEAFLGYFQLGGSKTSLGFKRKNLKKKGWGSFFLGAKKNFEF